MLYMYVYLIPLYTIYQSSCGDHFYWWKNSMEYPKKTITFCQSHLITNSLTSQSLVLRARYDLNQWAPPPPSPFNTLISLCTKTSLNMFYSCHILSIPHTFSHFFFWIHVMYEHTMYQGSIYLRMDYQ